MLPRVDAKVSAGAVVAKLPHRQLFGWSIGCDWISARRRPSSRTLDSMGVLIIMVPAATGVLAGIVIGFHPLDKRMHDQLVSILAHHTAHDTAAVVAAAQTGLPFRASQFSSTGVGP